MANVKWSSFGSGGDMQVGDQTVGLRSGDNFRFDFPSVGIKDANGNYLLQWASAGAAAVNYVQTFSAIASSSPYITSAGSDTNPNLTLKTQGSGNILFTPGGTGNIQASTHLILSTSSPLTSLEAASKGYVDSTIISTPVSLANGGTGASLVANNGGIFYSNATTGAILAGTATANQVLLSGASSAPAWSTATYPPTTTINQILYSSSNNVIGGISTANNGLLVTGATGVPSILAGPGSTGNILQSNSGSAPTFSTATYPSTTTINQLLYSSSNNTVSGLATGNNGVLITSAGGVPSISSTLPSAVQGNITTVGTITSGTWNGSVITGQYGGTGVSNTGKTITLGGSLTTSGAFDSTFTMTNTTSVTFPTSGTLATTSQLPTLPLSLSNGGTGASLTAANGGIVYSNASTLAILAPTATMNQILMSGSNTTPAWSTATYPPTTTINQLLYSSSANTITGLATANNSILATNGSGVPSITGTLPFTVPVSTGGTGNTTFTAYSVICAGTTATGAFQNVSGVGSANQVLTSNGPGLLPTWQASAGSGTVNNGTQNQLAWYATSGTAVSGLTTANDGLLVTSNTGVPSILAGPGTTGNILQSNAAAAPSFSTATYPSTTTVSQILYSSATNVVSGLATANSAVLVTGSTGVPVMSSTMTNGQVIIGSTGATPTAATLTAGTGVTITNGAGSITIAATGTGISTVAIQTFTANGTYTPTSGMKYCVVRCIGGGGAGGGSIAGVSQFNVGAGGGSGSYSESVVSAATIGASKTVTIGAGGTGGSGTGGNGGDTSLGTIVIAKGGTGGSTGVSSASFAVAGGGAGGVAGTGNITFVGNAGGIGFSSGVTFAIGGYGGCGPLGGGSVQVASSVSSNDGVAGSNYGAGGSGAASVNNVTKNGGNGAGGAVIIIEYI